MSVQRQRINDFAELRSVAGFMRGFERPWYIAGGWAIDLFLGYQTRPHKDIEIAIFRSDQRALYEHLAGWQAEQVVESRRQPGRGEWLAPPVHEIHARRPHGNPGQLEILLDEREGDLWRFRRNPAIVLPVALLGVRSSLGVPLLAPEVALLYKAKYGQPEDDADFASALAPLGDTRRRWLAQALRICHPGHPWLARLW